MNDIDQSKLDTLLEPWRGFPTPQESNRAKIIEFISWIYKKVGIDEPEIYICDSPLHLLEELNNVRKLETEIYAQYREESGNNFLLSNIDVEIITVHFEELSKKLGISRHDTIDYKIFEILAYDMVGKAKQYLSDTLNISIAELEAVENLKKSIIDQQRLDRKIKNLAGSLLPQMMLNKKQIWMPFHYLASVAVYPWTLEYQYYKSLGYLGDPDIDRYVEFMSSGVLFAIFLQDYCFISKYPVKYKQLDPIIPSKSHSMIGFNDGFEIYYIDDEPFTESEFKRMVRAAEDPLLREQREQEKLDRDSKVLLQELRTIAEDVLGRKARKLLTLFYLNGQTLTLFKDLQQFLEIPKATLSSHLKTMEEEGLIEVEKKLINKNIHNTYQIRPEGILELKNYIKQSSLLRDKLGDLSK